MSLFNNRRKDYSIKPPVTNVQGLLTVTDSPNIDFTYFNNNLTANLRPTGVANNTYGSSTFVPVITVDIYGRITSISQVAVSGGGGGSILTTDSITGDGTLGNEVKLVNDQASPGNDKYYGTNNTGTKGYYNLPSSGVSLEIESEGVSIETNVDTINFKDAIVTNPSAGKVDVTVEGYNTFLYEFYNY